MVALRTISNRIVVSIIFILAVLCFTLASLFNTLFTTNIDLFKLFMVVLFLILVIIIFIWLYDKLNYKNDDEGENTKELSFIIMLIPSIYFAVFLIFIFSVLLDWTSLFVSVIGNDMTQYLFLFFLTLNNFIILIHFNDVFKQQKRPNAYIFKFFNHRIATLSNNYETVFTLKVFGFVVFFLLPALLLNFILSNLFLTYLLESLAITTLVGSYWLGYGLYKNFVWIWGVPGIVSGQEAVSSKIPIYNLLRNLRKKEGQSVLFGFIFTLYSIVMFLLSVIFAIDKSLLIFPNVFTLLVLFYAVMLYIIILPVIGTRTETQPWFSISFIMFIFSLPYYVAFCFEYVITTNNANLFINFDLNSTLVSPLLILLLFISIVILFKVSNKYLTVSMWKDPYEANQLLVTLKESLKNPTSIQLNLLQKLSNSMDDNDTIIKIIASYELLLKSEKQKKNNEFLNGLVNFILNQILISQEDKTLTLLFDLTHNLLDEHPKYTENLFESYFNLIKSGDSFVKKETFNVIGHIIQLNAKKTFVDKIFNELFNLYASPDEKLKRQILDSLPFFINNYPEYREQTKIFLKSKLELETFGLSTIIFSVLTDIYHWDSDDSIFDLAENILESFNSPAKLGAVNFLKTNFPVQENYKKIFINLFMNNLKDIDNAIGVRTNIIYAINELITKDKSNTYLLDDLKFLLYDSDPDVKSALIQTYTDQFLLDNLQVSEILEVFDKGLNEQDYIVRLVVIRSIKAIKDKKTEYYNNLDKIVKKAQKDDSQIIKEEINKLLN